MNRKKSLIGAVAGLGIVVSSLAFAQNMQNNDNYSVGMGTQQSLQNGAHNHVGYNNTSGVSGQQDTKSNVRSLNNNNEVNHRGGECFNGSSN